MQEQGGRWEGRHAGEERRLLAQTRSGQDRLQDYHGQGRLRDRAAEQGDRYCGGRPAHGY